MGRTLITYRRTPSRGACWKLRTLEAEREPELETLERNSGGDSRVSREVKLEKHGLFSGLEGGTAPPAAETQSPGTLVLPEPLGK